MSAKSKGQLTLAVAVLQTEMRAVLRRMSAIEIDVQTLEGDFFVLTVGMAASAGIMLGYLVSYWVQK